MATGCPHCGSDRPPVEDLAFRLACPACGGPRLPAGTFVADPDKERASTAALVRAKAKGDRAKWPPRLIAASASLLTLSALMSLFGGHLSFFGVFAALLMWATFGLGYRRRHALLAARTKADLDEAYALAGTSSAHLRVMVEASPATGTAAGAVGAKADADAEAHQQALAEAEAEAEKEDAFADFDRRLAEAQKKQ
jgi:hypothetical protein